MLDQPSGNQPPAAARTFGALVKLLRRTIVDGPVTHAGGLLATGPQFHYDGCSESTRFSAAIWQDLSLVGHWIQDATVQRWAELTSEIAQQAIRPSAVIDLLLTVPISSMLSCL